MAGRAKRRTDGTARTRTLDGDARVDKRFHKANVLSGVPCWRIGSLVRLAAHALLRQRRGASPSPTLGASCAGVRRVEAGN